MKLDKLFFNNEIEVLSIEDAQSIFGGETPCSDGSWLKRAACSVTQFLKCDCNWDWVTAPMSSGQAAMSHAHT